MTSHRQENIDFTKVFMTLSIGGMLRDETISSEQLTSSPFYFLHPLSYLTWFYLSIVFIVTTFTYYVIDRMDTSRYSGAQKSNIANVIWLTLSTMCLRATNIVTNYAPSRILLTSLWIFSLLVMATFVANLTATLIASKLQPSNSAAYSGPQDLADLVRSFSHLQYITIRNSHVAAYLQRSNLAYVSRLWQTISDCGDACFVESVEEGVRRASEEGCVFLWESPIIRYYTSRDCHLLYLEQSFDFLSYSLGLMKDSPYTEEVSASIMRLTENEQLNLLQNKYCFRHCKHLLHIFLEF